MELKLPTSVAILAAFGAINRTIMELKPERGICISNLKGNYQSHHHGIETA